jgi:hypothetical protein
VRTTLKTLWIAAFLAFFAAPPRARAQDRSDAGRGVRFGAPGTVALAAERLFGVTQAIQSNGPDITTLSLLGPGGTEIGSAPYSVPRLAFDAFLAGGLTLGIGAQYAHTSSGGAIDVLGVNPRVGWAPASDGGLALWPRAGLSYVRLSDDVRSSYLLALSLELQLVIPAAQHVAFAVSPTFDVGVASTSRNVTQLGLQASLLAWF